MAPFGAEALLADGQALEAETSGRKEYLARIAADCPSGTTWSAISDMSVARAIEDAAKDLGAGAVVGHPRTRGSSSRAGQCHRRSIAWRRSPVLVFRPQH